MEEGSVSKLKKFYLFSIFILTYISLVVFTTMTNFNLTGYSYSFHGNGMLTIERGFFQNEQVLQIPINEAIKAIELISEADHYWNMTFSLFLLFTILISVNYFKALRPEKHRKRYAAIYLLLLVAILLWIIPTQLALTEEITKLVSDLKGEA